MLISPDKYIHKPFISKYLKPFLNKYGKCHYDINHGYIAQWLRLYPREIQKLTSGTHYLLFTLRGYTITFRKFYF